METCSFCGQKFEDTPGLPALVKVNCHLLFGGCERTKEAAEQLRRQIAKLEGA
jgi:hypothetical protein